MFYIVESEEQLNYLCALGRKGCYIEVIPSSDSFHQKLTSTVAVYIRPLDHKEGYILPVSHLDGLNISREKVQEVIDCFETKYVVSKKNFLYHFRGVNVIDLGLVYSMTNYETLSLPNPPQTINWYYNKHRSNPEINKIIPLPKLFERSERNFRSIEDLFEQSQEIISQPAWKFYNDVATAVYFTMEQSGLKIKEEEFIELFKPNTPAYSINGGKVFTSYNPYNITSRPTNAFNSVNFAAIPKKGGHRETIIPANDCFVEFDFDGYHIRLLAELVGEPILGKSAHTELAKMYFKKDDITEEEYNQGKQITFQIVYGKIPEEYQSVSLFEKIGDYIENLWKMYKSQGYIEDPISKRRLTKELKEMHPQKLMNYMMQSLETSRNIRILYKVLKYLQDKSTVVALYTYDAILFDFDKKDGKQTLVDLQNILSEEDKYPVKFKASNSLVL